MTLDEAITHCSEVIGEKYLDGHVKCASNHEQLKEWLEELKELKNPQPYKFEELKAGMWVWDDRLKACFLIKAIRPKTNWNIVIYANYLTDTFEELEFEENRFFPLIKAMEYQGKAGDEK